MRPYIGKNALDAEFSVEKEGSHLALILESSSGRPGGGRRNADYNSALDLLITRLRERDAVLLDALVNSRRTRDWPEEARRLKAGPISFSDYPDSIELR